MKEEREDDHKLNGREEDESSGSAAGRTSRSKEK